MRRQTSLRDKRRVLDNADRGEQSALSSDSKKLTEPAQHVSAAMRCLPDSEVAVLMQADIWEGGG